MNLSVKDAAGLLQVSEKSIYRWIKQTAIPAYKIGGQHRFNRSELLEWATSKHMEVSPEAFAEPEIDKLPMPLFSEALEAGGVFYRIDGKTRDEVLTQISTHLRLPEDTDQKYLARALVEREKSASTGIGDGIAIPHLRVPLFTQVVRPSMTLFFLENPVDFYSLDGILVNILFTPLAPTQKTHLYLLSKLGFLLKNKNFRNALINQENREVIFSTLREAEKELNSLITLQEK
ncbi:MAG: PTS sugar transporter subunit IIA [Desulfuromusa sp.]